MRPADVSRPALAELIDHVVLRPTVVTADLEAACRLVAEYAVSLLCVRPHGVGEASPRLAETGAAISSREYPTRKHIPSLWMAPDDEGGRPRLLRNAWRIAVSPRTPRVPDHFP